MVCQTLRAAVLIRKDIAMVKTIATCAKCGDKKELCGSVKYNGIQQPRICKDCLLEQMQTGDETINDSFWITQLAELGDNKSLELLKAEANT